MRVNQKLPEVITFLFFECIPWF